MPTEIEVRSPFDSRVVGTVAILGQGDVTAAIDAAAAAMKVGWPAHERAAVLARVAQLIGERTEELAQSITAEAGKPIKLARIEAARAVATFEAAATAARTLAGEVIPPGAGAQMTDHLAYTLRVPRGVVGAITPFNFPLNLVAHKVAPALAAGCSIVLKPSEKTPLTALLLHQICAKAGVPEGRFAVVTGDPAQIVQTFIDDSRVAVLTFTGSAAVGWDIKTRTPRKHVLLELGNITPAIVCADADMEKAAAALAPSAFAFAGQTCISTQNIIVEDSGRPAFFEAFKAATARLVTGDPANDATDVGPMITQAAATKLRERIAAATADGVRLLSEDGGEGSLVPPQVLAGGPAATALRTEEAFAPVVVMEHWTEFAEAVAAANRTEFGLQAAIFTSDVTRALAAAPDLEFGAVLINESPSFRIDAAPYGGTKASGNTREGPLRAVIEMTEERMVVLRTGGN